MLLFTAVEKHSIKYEVSKEEKAVAWQLRIIFLFKQMRKKEKIHDFG